jgi:cysteinyl-tRNA synthetase
MSQIQFYNSLTHRVEPFEPIDPPRVSIYNCGPTVYDFAHVGNFRAFVFADVTRRFLELVGYDVHQVMNITDVGHMTEDQLADGGGEDKMAVAIQRLQQAKASGELDDEIVADPTDPYQVAEYYTQAFLDDARALRIQVADEPAHLPRATQYVPQMLEVIEKLVDNGSAYVAEDGAVYFSVEQYPEYGRLSGNTIDKLKGGAGGRVSEAHQSVKRHPADFLLWKPDPSHVMKWGSKFGEGYPGWHIECSTMAMFLHHQDTIDIHTGGEDNIFPHHECEIAQACCYSGKPRFANYWLHTRFLMVEGEKMSKSKGNFYTVRQLREQGIDPAVIRYELMKGHYRANADLSTKSLRDDSASAVRRIRDFAHKLEREAQGQTAEVDPHHPALGKFIECLSDDLNVAGALGVVFEFMQGRHPDPAQSLAVLRQFDHVLGVLPRYAGEDEPDEAALAKCRQIDAARQEKDFATADRLRDELKEAGYDVQQSKQGTTVTPRLA